MRHAWLALSLLLVGCETDPDAGWVAFNAPDESISVQVTTRDPVDDAVSINLTSTTGAVVVGTASVAPASGPVGTEHTVTVLVDDEYEETVSRVTLETAGDRGEQRHTLVRDSADLGLWVVDVTSLGEQGEERTDTFTVRLWRPADEGEEPDPEAEDTGEGG